MRLSKLLGALLLATGLVISGCNLYGKIDSPKSLDEHLNEAQVLMDTGQCQEAVTKLESFNVQGTGVANDRFYQLYGWAQLCAAGAPFDKVAGTLLTFSSTSTNSLQVVGNLVNSIGPAAPQSITSAGNAKITFAKISDSNKSQRLIYSALADVVQAAMYVSKNSTNGKTTSRADIAPAGCLSLTCSTAPVGCTFNTLGKMTDADAVAFFLAVQDASGLLGQGSGFGNAADLVTNLLSVLAGGAANAVRCSIVNNMLAN